MCWGAWAKSCAKGTMRVQNNPREWIYKDEGHPTHVPKRRGHRVSGESIPDY